MVRVRSLRRAVAAVVLGAGTLVTVATAAPANASGPTSLGVSGWQVYASTATYANPVTSSSDTVYWHPNTSWNRQIHGNPDEFAAAPAVPAEGDGGWADCGGSSPLRGTSPICPDATTIGMNVRSILTACQTRLNFTYFQALVSIPAGTDVTQFSVEMNGADDGARILLVNSDHPGGVTPTSGFIYEGTPQATGDLSDYVVAGEVNRVVIMQVDDCPSGNNLRSAQVFLNGSVIPPVDPNTPPSVAVTGVADGASYEIGAVPAADCAADDAEDGATSPAPVVSALDGPLAAYGLGSQTVTCSFTDAGDLSATASVTYSVVDTGDPTLSGAPTTSPNPAGWYSGPVTISWTATDGGSGIDPATMPGDVVLSGDGTGQTASASVADRSGNTASAVSAPAVDIDGTAPIVGFTGATSYGLLDTVDIDCSATDALSGLDASSTCPSASGAAWSFAPGVQPLEASVSDVAGNTASATTSFEVTATGSALCGLVRAFTGHNGTRTSLCAHLTSFERSSSRGQSGPAAKQLDAFRKEAGARSGKQLTAAQVAVLIGWANTL